ncbi:EAL domain-containing protein [Aeromonas sp. MdU4]|uniref:EAL domain-containing protein n=1 Tax=Aeromonas sp. MdU4 TaxID=3342819 RepID=UPI0035B6CB73
MKYQNIDRLFLEKPKLYNFAIFIVSISFGLIAIFLLFNYEKGSIVIESERYVRRTVVEINKLFSEVEQGVNEVFESHEQLICPSSINHLVDTATRNPYTMMYYMVDRLGGECSSYKNSNGNVNSIHQQIQFIDLKTDGVYLQIFMNRPVFLLVRNYKGTSVVGVVDTRYITDLILDHNDMGDAISYGLTIDSNPDAQILTSIGLAPPLSSKSNMQSHSEKYGFGITSYVKSDAYIVMTLLKVYGWFVFIIIGFSIMIFIMLSSWVKRIDFISQDIRKGITRNEFIPYIQPIVNSSTLEIVGGEVLVRWQHPVYGLISPELFVEATERSGAIIPITEQLMAVVATRLSSSDVLVPPRFTINFNVTLSQLISPDLVQACSHFLEIFGDKSRLKLCLEIVERGMLDDHTELQMMTAFKLLHAQGISFAVDDFGTGYSSLRHVYSSYIGAIKIDRLFVKDIDSNKMAYEIIMNIIDLAARIGAKIVAEGIEKPIQAKILSKMGVDCFQGYLYGKPMPVDLFVGHFMRASDQPNMERKLC